MKNKLHSVRTYLVVYLLMFLFVNLITFQIYQIQMGDISRSLTESIRSNLLMNDSRSAITALSPSIGVYFQSVTFVDSNGKVRFFIGDSKSFLTQDKTYGIGLSDDDHTSLSIIYSYSLLPMIITSALSFIIILGMTIPIYFYQERQLKKILNLRIESEKKNNLNLAFQRVAHDIRSPLTALNFLTSDLNSIEPEQKDIISSVIKRINGIADDLLAESKAGEKITSKKDFELANENYFCNVNLALIALIEEKRLEFKLQREFYFDLRLENHELLTFLDKNELLRIISNLINNSVEAYVSDGRIIVEAFHRNDMINISIHDHGRGIPTEILERLFTQRYSFGKGKTKGNGIGLFSAYNTLRLIGGDIQIASKLGVGTKVVLQIPKIPT